MEELTLNEQMAQLQKDKDHHYESLNAVTNALDILIKQDRERKLPKISSDTFDKLLSIVEECITNNRIETGSNADIYYSINDNEIEADITLTNYFTGEVISDIRSAVDESDFLAIIEDGN